MQTSSLPLNRVDSYPPVDLGQVEQRLEQALTRFQRKIVVLDDDPTGVQTVHGVSVYTDWKEETVRAAFLEQKSIFFLMTNSRSFTQTQTKEAHMEITQHVATVSKELQKDFLLISRSDSTLRGHYPLETQVLREELERLTPKKFDGEVIIPFFVEGGRYTIDNIHYVREGERLIPAAETEFAQDKSFGFTQSHLGEWCREKTAGLYHPQDMIYIGLDLLRSLDYGAIRRELERAEDFNKIIVNAVDYVDVKIFCTALLESILGGKEYIIRSAAALTKVIGGIPDRPLLTRKDLVADDNHAGGIVLVGSHVQKTSRQLDELRKSQKRVEFIEFNQHLILEEEGLAPEVERVVALINEKIRAGISVAVYTRRERIDADADDKDAQLKMSVEISDAVTSIIAKLTVRPSFIIAKGGITSSDVGTKALEVKKATVMGQIKPGVPVWMTGAESKFPNMPYIIFPGNVGEVETLREAVETLME